MSAANASVPSPSLEEEMRAHEPSMEEILASIRRIIADDDSLPGVRRDRDNQRRARDAEEPAAVEEAPSAQSAYPAPALERRESPVAAPAEDDHADMPEVEEPAMRETAPVADIRQLRLNRATQETAAATPEPQTAEEDRFESESVSSAADLDEFAIEDNGAALMSPDAASSIATHFQALAASMVINDSGLLQKYAQEMMRPMLKQWLDDNLPVIVERLVRAEIERVARGGRR